MRPDRCRLLRLKRIERARAIAKRTAALEAALAEQTRAQLAALSDRTGELAAGSSAPGAAADAWALRNALAFADQLHDLDRATRADAARAGTLAEASMAELAVSERRRAVVAERIADQARRLAGGVVPSAAVARRGFGTGLE